jgi:hypothetical protein
VASARGAIEAYGGGRLMNWFMSDRARSLFGYLVYYLELTDAGDAQQGGLTPTRLKRACAATGLCSPGRAGAMLALMRAAGYMTLVSEPGDRRIRQLVATDKLKDMLRMRMRPQMSAASIVIPELRTISNLLGNDAFEREIVRWFGDRFVEGFRFVMHCPELAMFAEHNAGMVILFSLMLPDNPSGTFPPDAPVTTSVAGLARRFKVSRTHVLRLLRAAEREGHIKRVGEHYDRIILQPHLIQGALNLFATMFLFVAGGAQAAKDKVS